jgi:hypothetical protein
MLIEKEAPGVPRELFTPANAVILTNATSKSHVVIQTPDTYQVSFDPK